MMVNEGSSADYICAISVRGHFVKNHDSLYSFHSCKKENSRIAAFNIDI